MSGSSQYGTPVVIGPMSSGTRGRRGGGSRMGRTSCRLGTESHGAGDGCDAAGGKRVGHCAPKLAPKSRARAAACGSALSSSGGD